MLFVERTYHEKVTTSDITLKLDGKEWKCKGLELPWRNNERKVSCIPEGLYKVVKRLSPKYGNHFHITDVDGRDWILIHHGNYTRDILGCVLVGRTHADIDRDGIIDVTHSKATMDELNKVAPNEFMAVFYEKGKDPGKLIWKK
jgi:hypothetical protein